MADHSKTHSKHPPHEGRRRARRRALQAIYQWQIAGHSAHEIVSQFLEEQDWTSADSAYFELLVKNIIQHNQALDLSLEAHLDRPMEQVDFTERAILRIAAWELSHQPEVPYRAVLNEAVDLAKRYGAEQGHSYVNGVLDKAAKVLRQAETSIDTS